MGAGHSGSTILGVALGNCEGFFYAGELEEWLITGDTPRWALRESQQFWSAVRERVSGGDLLFGSAANRCIERSSAVLRVDLWLERRRLRRRYGEVAERLIDAVAELADARQVVDTSHFPLRARELRTLSGIDLVLVYLVRDPQEVVASNVRELSLHEVAERRWRTLVMNANLCLTQLVSLVVFLTHPRNRRIFVRHEDFLLDPEGVIRQILQTADARVEVPDLARLSVGSPLQGGRLIRAQEVAVRRSRADARPAPPSSLMTRLVQAPWQPLLGLLRPVATPGRARDGHDSSANASPEAPEAPPVEIH
ncbi:MAG: hypothetical protein QOG40_1503 [Solirubrobacteraceae bacterium]|jgi:hypothetical protein|nr:hypothetical protein [Solirubrobacteraceae bacterium]